MTEVETPLFRFAKSITPLRKARRWFLNEVWGDLRLYLLTMACAFTWRTEFLLPVVRDAAGADEFDSLAGAILQPGRIFCG